MRTPDCALLYFVGEVETVYLVEGRIIYCDYDHWPGMQLKHANNNNNSKCDSHFNQSRNSVVAAH